MGGFLNIFSNSTNNVDTFYFVGHSYPVFMTMLEYRLHELLLLCVN